MVKNLTFKKEHVYRESITSQRRKTQITKNN